MLLPSIIADSPQPGGWTVALYGAIATVLGTAAAYVTGRLNKRHENADRRQEKGEEGEATVRVAQINAAGNAARDILDNYKDITRASRESLHNIRNEMNAMRLALEAEIARLADKVDFVKDAYHHLHGVTAIIHLQFRQQRARLRRMDPAFDEAEFPDYDIAPFHPDRIFARVSPAAAAQ